MFYTISKPGVVVAFLLAGLASLLPGLAAYAAAPGLPANTIWVHTPGRVTPWPPARRAYPSRRHPTIPASRLLRMGCSWPMLN